MPSFSPGEVVHIPCEVGVGQFGSEFAISGKSADGSAFSLFAPEDYVDWDEAPTETRTVGGWLRVLVVEKQGNRVLVRLPRQAMENGEFITVREDQLEVPPRHRKR